MDAPDHPERRMQQRLQAALERSAADIDPVSETRLRDARHKALAAAQSRWRPLWRWLAIGVPAAAVATLVLLVGDVSLRRSDAPAAPADAIRDLDLLTSGESLDLLEDLELIRWLPPARRS